MSSIKLCIECGEKYEPRTGESDATFAKRIYCSQKCVLTYLARKRFLRKHPEETDMTP